MKRKLVSTFLAATLCAAMLAGCGDSPQNSGSTSSDSGSSQQESQEESQQSSEAEESSVTESTGGEESSEQSGEESGGQAAAGGDWHYTNVDSLENPNVTVCLYWDPNEFEQAAISEFEAKYGGKVTVEVVGWNKGANAIMTAMATGDIPDLVFTEGNARFPLDAANELYQPIDAYLDYDVCDQASADAFLYRGGHYVYTNNAITAPYLIIYNATVFEEEALETPTELFDKGEWTYDKFLEYMAYFTRDTDGDGEIDQWGLGPRFKRQNFASANDAFPVYEVGDGKLAVGIDSENMVQYYTFLNTFGTIDTNCPGDSGWLESRACVMFSEAGPSAGLSEDYTGSDVFDFVPIPTYDGRLATTPVWDNGYAMVAGAPNPEGAAVLASMICQKTMEAYDATLASKYDENQIARYQAIMEQIVPQRRNANCYQYNGQNVTVGAGESEALKGEPAQTVIETYKKQLENEVAAYNLFIGQ